MAKIELKGDKKIIITFNNSHACLWWLDKIRSDMNDTCCNVMDTTTITQDGKTE